MTLGDILKQYRDENKISMDDFSKRSGLSKGYISMLENNTNPRSNKPIAPTLQTIKKIANGMNMDVDTLLKKIDSNQEVSLKAETDNENKLLLGKVLKELRIKAGYSQKYVYDILNINQSTFSAWETGRAEPSVDMLLKLCKLYNVKDIFAAFGYDGYNDDGSIRLNLAEVDLVEKYRALDAHGRKMVDLVLKEESERSEAIVQEEESEYIELVARGGKYKVKKADVVEWAKQLDLDDYEEDHDLC